MKEAIGQSFSLEFIFIFMLVLNGYLAFNVNYTKAFRVKNEIRSIIQKNEGLTQDAASDISNYMQKVSYHQNPDFTDWCGKQGYKVCSTSVGSFCYEVATSPKYGTDKNGNEIAAYYTIYTFVDMNIPFINNLLPSIAGLFTVSGETSLIYTKDALYEGEYLISESADWCKANPTQS